MSIKTCTAILKWSDVVDKWWKFYGEVRLRRPNSLKAKWGHVPNFRVKSVDKCKPQILRYLWVITAPPNSASRFISHDWQRPSSTLIVLGTCKSVLSVMFSKFSAKSPPLEYLGKVLDLLLVQGSNSSYQSSLDNPSERFPDQSIGHGIAVVRLIIHSASINYPICIVFCKNML